MFKFAVRLTEQFVTVGFITLRFYCRNKGGNLENWSGETKSGKIYMCAVLLSSSLRFPYLLGRGKEHP